MKFLRSYVQVMLGNFKVPAMYVALQAVMSLYASGRMTASCRTQYPLRSVAVSLQSTR